MEIQLLTKTVMTAAEQQGYNTLLGDCSCGSAQTIELPTMCVVHPVMRNKEGRLRGVVTYRLEFMLMAQASKNLRVASSESDKEDDIALLTTLYNDALTIIERVDSLPEVCGLTCISSTPSKAKTTPLGDMALRVVIDVKLKFCK